MNKNHRFVEKFRIVGNIQVNNVLRSHGEVSHLSHLLGEKPNRELQSQYESLMNRRQEANECVSGAKLSMWFV